MDRFVRNLFEGIDIPHDFPNDEGIAKPATGRPENPIHVSRDADGPRGQVSQTLPEPEINEPEQKVHKYSVPALTAGLSATKSSCSFARPNRKPIFDVKKPFVTPQHFKPSPEPVSQHFKRPREETTQLKSDEAPTQTHDAHINNGALPFARKPVSERYPLKGPAGSILRNPLFDM
ncbi:cellulose synthase, putative [Babesia caballi]|uniref:Cellulose synthase, putative n=1 Tax=Babesia caballi TaxID=5871 RepID=A0AAV4LQ09_BABCB|nr:cellulose synthase, putative [Babesia caballi]